MASRLLAAALIGCVAGIIASGSSARADGSARSGGAAFGRFRAAMPLPVARSGYIESIVHAFAGPPDGAVPGELDNLVLDDAGNLYGTNVRGRERLL